MSKPVDNERKYDLSRRIVPADELDYLNIVREHPRVAPAVGIYDAPVRCFKANTEWAAHICGAVASLLNWTAWEGAEDDTDPAVQAIYEFLKGTDCGMYQLRQSPTNNCILEQSVDGGVTWTTAFNFNLCISPYSAQTKVESMQIGNNYYSWVGDTINTWNNNIINIAPDGVMDGTAEDDIRNQAMCYAVNLLVTSLGQQVRGQVENGGTDWKDYVRWFADGVITGGEFFLGTHFLWATTVAPEVLAACGIAIGAAQFVKTQLPEGTEPDFESLLEPDVQSKLICCAMSVLEDNTPSVALFATIFDSCEIPALDDDTMQLLQYLVDQEEIYVSFLAMIQRAFDAIQGGQSFTCPTCDPWCHTDDFLVADGGFVNFDVSSFPGDQFVGVWQSGTGWVDTDLSYGTVHIRGCAAKRSFARRSITSLSCDYDAILGNGADNDTFACRLRLWLEGAVVHDSVVDNFGVNQTLEVNFGTPVDADEIGFDSRPGYVVDPQTDLGAGYVHIKSLTVCGDIGTDPF